EAVVVVTGHRDLHRSSGRTDELQLVARGRNGDAQLRQGVATAIGGAGHVREQGGLVVVVADGDVEDVSSTVEGDLQFHRLGAGRTGSGGGGSTQECGGDVGAFTGVGGAGFEVAEKSIGGLGSCLNLESAAGGREYQLLGAVGPGLHRCGNARGTE